MASVLCSQHRMTLSREAGILQVVSSACARSSRTGAWLCIGLMRVIAGLILATMGPVLWAAPAPSSALAGELQIGGTGSGLGTMQKLATHFEKEHPGVRITIPPSLGSSGGIQALQSGKLSLSVSSRPLTDAERAKSLESKLIATTAFVFAVSPKVPATDLTLDELAALYSGKTSTWSDGSLVRPVLRPLTDVDTRIVREMSASLDSAIQEAHLRPGKNVAITDTDSADEIAGIGGAIGTSTLALIVSESRDLRALSVGGVAPTITNIREGLYPYRKSLYLIAPANPSELSKAFTAFIDSPEGVSILESTGNIPSGSAKWQP